MDKQIIDTRTNPIPFGSLEIGDCFIESGELYIKIYDVYERITSQRYNAININRGSIHHFYDEDNVGNINSLEIKIS